MNPVADRSAPPPIRLPGLPSARRAAELISDDFGLTAVVGLEHELYFTAGAPASWGRAVTDLRGALAGSGSAPAVQAETGPGQHELVFRPDADLAALLERHRQAVTLLDQASGAAGTAVSYASKPYADQPGSALHVNVSLRDRAGRNLLRKPAHGPESPTLLYAVNGLLETMLTLMPAFAPTDNCYQRYRLRTAAEELFCPGYVSWGGDNRSAAVRIPTSTRHPHQRRLEHRVSGAQACPEQAVAAVLLGIHRGLGRGEAPRLPKLYGIATRCRDELTAFPADAAAAYHRYLAGYPALVGAGLPMEASPPRATTVMPGVATMV